MLILNSSIFSRDEEALIQSRAHKLNFQSHDEIGAYGVDTFKSIVEELKKGGPWPYQQVTNHIYEVAVLDLWISQNSDHQLIVLARHKLHDLMTVTGRFFSLSKIDSAALQSITLPKFPRSGTGIAKFLEVYGRAVDMLKVASGQIKRVMSLLRKQTDVFTVLSDQVEDTARKIREAERAAMEKISSETIDLDSSTKLTIEAIEAALEAYKTNK